MKWTSMAALCALAGCSVPDPWDMDDIKRDVAALPADVAASARQWAATRAVIDALDSKSPNEKIGEIYCEAADWETTWKIDVLVGDLRRCMVRPGASYTGCMTDLYYKYSREFMAEANALSDNFTCEWRFSPGWDADEVPDEWWDSRVTTDDIVDAMLRYAGSVPPPFAGSLPGGFLAKLCRAPLSSREAWGCPDAPGAAPGQTPGDDPGGDFP